MKCTILHETRGRMRVRLCCRHMTLEQADVLEYYLRAVDGVQSVKVYDRTRDAVVLYDAERGSIIRALGAFSFAKAEAMELVCTGKRHRAAGTGLHRPEAVRR